MRQFIPLTVRSHFSLMWGTASVPALCAAARRRGYTRLALTDTDNLYGLWPFLAACAREGLQPIVGAEITEPQTGARAVCLVENMEGYRNLCRLLTCRHMGDTSWWPAVTEPGHTQASRRSAPVAFSLKDSLIRFAQGLVVLTRTPELLQPWYDAGVNVVAAMPRRPLHREHPLCRTARFLGVPLAATPGSFFLHPADQHLHACLRAIDRRTCLSRLSPNQLAPQEAWLAPPQEYVQRFDPCPAALHQTTVLAERLTFTRPDFGLVMPPWRSAGSDSADEELRIQTYAGARRRYGDELSEAVVDRIEHELRIIARMEFAAYFLVVRSIVVQSSRRCGRGSAAASIVAYCLNITNVCPVKHNLYFERFLNPGRKDPPDIDVDFAWDERDQVLAKVLARYPRHAAMVCNHVTFRSRMAIREVAGVFGLGAMEIARVVNQIPWFWSQDGNTDDYLIQLQQLPGLKNFAFARPWPEIIDLARQIMGAPRYLGVHSGGVVITPRPIHEYVPVQMAAKGVPILQWEKDAVEDAGLVKIDLLGNRSLGVIRDAIANIRPNGRPFDEIGWEPEDDFATQEALARGATMGCFYIESPAMRLLQQKAAVGDFEHLVIHSSIIRPAANTFIREYIQRLHGGGWRPVHPLLEEVLSDTFGIMVYQEDVSRVATGLAGFSHVEADRLRKIMARKDRAHRLQDYRQRFADGAAARGLTHEQIDTIWAMMMSFSGYSFCKPHSASYAHVSFQAAYLKVHFPAEFMAAVISNQGGFYSTLAYVSEARRLGLTILPPDVTQSDICWHGGGNTLRVGLGSIKSLGARTAGRIVAQRQQQSFNSMPDFLNRVRPNEAEARSLIHCGALDPLHACANRTALLWQFAAWQQNAGSNAAAPTLFSEPPDAPAVPVFPSGNPHTRLQREFTALGFLCGCHPMHLVDRLLQNRNVVNARNLPRHINRRIRFAGWLLTGKTVHTRHGEAMEFLTFEDDTGLVETTFFPQACRAFGPVLERGRPYILSGTVQQDWGAVTLTVDQAELITGALHDGIGSNPAGRHCIALPPGPYAVTTSPLASAATGNNTA